MLARLDTGQRHWATAGTRLRQRRPSPRARLRSLPIVGRWFQPSLRPLQQHLDIGRLARGHERSDIPDAQDRPSLKHLIGKLLEPTPHRGFLARLSEARDRRLDHVGGPLVVLPVECVANGLKPFSALLVPDARAPMEVRDAVRLLAQQARPKDIREEVVVSVPLSARVERDHEEVPAIEILQCALTAILTRDRIAQRPVSRSRMQVQSRNRRTSSDWRSRTSSTR